MALSQDSTQLRQMLSAPLTYQNDGALASVEARLEARVFVDVVPANGLYSSTSLGRIESMTLYRYCLPRAQERAMR